MLKIISFNWLLLLPVTALVCLSLLVISSLNREVFSSHLISLILGLIVFSIASLIDWPALKRFSWIFYLLPLLLLLLTFFLGVSSRGAVRWLDLGFTAFQPSELVKLGLIIFLAGYFSQFDRIELPQFLISALFLLPGLALVLFQPDLGSALIIFFLWLSLVFTAGLNWRFFVLGALLVLVTLPVGWHLLQPYQKQRITVFLEPNRDPLGGGYNVIQSVVAVGSGGLFGYGLGHGPQSHLRFLPEAHTDFIFASLSEELGFVGSFLTLALLCFLCFQLIRLARQADSNFAYLVIIGVFALIFWQCFINIGMNLALLPVTGITLPLVSFGGSSMITVLAALGIVNNLSRFRRENKVKYAL